MAAEIKSIRDKTRRLKDLAIDKAIDIFVNPSKYSEELVTQTFLKVIGNVVPRTQEVTGEDGGALVVEISKEIATKNNLVIDPNTNDSVTNSSTSTNSTGHTQV